MTPLYIFDLDGTLADLTHRLHFIDRDSPTSPDWQGFFEACINDKPIFEMIGLARKLKQSGCEIWIVSGRSDQVREETICWLNAHCVPHDVLLMRSEGDYRPDYKIKQEMLDNMLDQDRDRIMMTLDDRDQVVQMWRSNDILCLQVAPGNF
jgi:FMN phosphatase YigB (HAD superfamily)